ncbi:unnamed protein product, partial [Mesorhabditis spiculigera]
MFQSRPQSLLDGMNRLLRSVKDAELARSGNYFFLEDIFGASPNPMCRALPSRMTWTGFPHCGPDAEFERIVRRFPFAASRWMSSGGQGKKP